MQAAKHGFGRLVIYEKEGGGAQRSTHSRGTPN